MTIAANSARVTFELRAEGSTRSAFCIIGVANDDAHVASYVAENARIDFSESLSFIQSENWSLISTHAELASGAEYTDPTIVPGEIAVESDPPHSAWLLRKSTGLAGRANRGRMYLPGVPASWTENNGTLVPANLATAVAAADSFWGKLVADDLTMVILHEAAGTRTPVTEFVPDSLLATQRRRLR